MSSELLTSIMDKLTSIESRMATKDDIANLENGMSRMSERMDIMDRKLDSTMEQVANNTELLDQLDAKVARNTELLKTMAAVIVRHDTDINLLKKAVAS